MHENRPAEKLVIHLDEAALNRPGWERMEYRDALAAGGTMSPDDAYMANELFSDEPVWVERQPVPELAVESLSELRSALREHVDTLRDQQPWDNRAMFDRVLTVLDAHLGTD